ncbi:MAG TPA: hypothetical protein VE844_03760, partial [Gammaproteobacteria bacterium]|nr:hypothetical protein [Gammaproteobacteria bacterium]
AGYTSLPCTPSVVAASGVTYYRCGSTWYTQAYAGGGVSYVTVAPGRIPIFPVKGKAPVVTKLPPR